MQAGVPLIAALIAWHRFREGRRCHLDGHCRRDRRRRHHGLGSLRGAVSPIGDGLALLIAVAFSIATVITRRYAHVRMTPATCLGTVIGARCSPPRGSAFAVSARRHGLLFAFGALNLGLGLAFFATGARLIPAAFAALLGTLETVLGPVWVWLIHGEVPSARTWSAVPWCSRPCSSTSTLEFRRQARPRAGRYRRPGPELSAIAAAARHGLAALAKCQ